MLSWLDAGRVVAGVGADLERRRAAVGDGAVVAERERDDVVQRGERRAGRHRIGGVGRHQQRRPVAAAQRALEAARNLDRKQHLARGQHAVELGLVAHLPRDLEVFGVFQRLEDRAPDVARFLQQHRGRQSARLGVDGIAEQHELHQRHGDDGREGDAVAAKLHEFLADHGADPPPEAAADEIGECAHDTLSLACAISPMKTSSSEASIGFQVELRHRRDGTRWRPPAPHGRGRRRAGSCRTARRCRRRAVSQARRQAAPGPRRSRCRW